MNDEKLDDNQKWFICSNCEKRYKSKTELKQHITSQCGTVKLFGCRVCGQKLMTPGSLHNHMLRHTSGKCYMCDYCGKMFLMRGQLKVHERIHTQEKIFVCNVCGKGFCHRQSLITHSSLHTGVKPYQCENCGRSFSCVGNLIKHRKTHAESCGSIPLLTHRVLNPKTKAKVQINTHNTKLKLIRKSKKLSVPQTPAKVELESCNQNEHQINKKTRRKPVEMYTNEEIQTFMKERQLDGLNELNCRFCNRKYNNVGWLMRHEKLHQDNKSNCTKTKDSHTPKSTVDTCEKCEKSFANPYSLKAHDNIFHRGILKKIYLYVCEKCGQQFKQKKNLLLHEKNNCATQHVFPCKICNKSFSSLQTVESHMKVHDPRKKFLCKFCGKSFRWKGQLKVHERSHTGEKPFKCLFCPKAFSYRESLVTHSSLHTGIKPYLCQACGSRFSCIGNLIKHRNTHASTCGTWYEKNQLDKS